MKYPCSLIRDLLPLYCDEVASGESRDAVEEHLKECDSCREYYSRMCGADEVVALLYDEERQMEAAASYQKMYKKVARKIGKIIAITVLVVVILMLLLYGVIVGYLKISSETSKETYNDIKAYEQYRRGENAIKNFTMVDAADAIFPERIEDGMRADDFLMMYESPWDSNYLGYLVVGYEEEDYRKEVERLSQYPSTDYVGIYGATGFGDCEVLAMDASYSGFVYAISDGIAASVGKNTIIYVELIFPGYEMEIDYEKYLPQEYLPDGLDVGKGNPTNRKFVERHERTKED